MAICNVDGTVNIPGLWKNGSTYDLYSRGKRIVSGVDQPMVSDVNELRQYIEQIRSPDPEAAVNYETGRKAAGILTGSISAGGQVVVNPDEWSAGQSGNGRYLITHNLNSYRYHVLVTVYTISEPGGERMGNVEARNLNNVLISVQNDEGKDRWNYFDITLVKI
jgi:hypothetical protein